MLPPVTGDDSTVRPGPNAPAGWYPDPEQVQTQRFWDGSNWTNQRAPLDSTPVDDDGYINVEVPPSAFLVLAGVVAVIVAVFLPYVDVPGQIPDPPGNTLIQNGEGVVLVVLAVVAVLAVYRRLTGAKWWWSTTALGLVMLAVVIYTALNLPELSVETSSGLGFEFEKLGAGVGIYLAGIGSVLVALGGFALPRSRL